MSTKSTEGNQILRTLHRDSYQTTTLAPPATPALEIFTEPDDSSLSESEENWPTSDVQRAQASKKVYSTEDFCQWTMIEPPRPSRSMYSTNEVPGSSENQLLGNGALVQVYFLRSQKKKLGDTCVFIDLGDVKEKFRICLKDGVERRVVVIEEMVDPNLPNAIGKLPPRAEDYFRDHDNRWTMMIPVSPTASNDEKEGDEDHEKCSSDYSSSSSDESSGDSDDSSSDDEDHEKVRSLKFVQSFQTREGSTLKFEFKPKKQTLGIQFRRDEDEPREIGFNFEIDGTNIIFNSSVFEEEDCFDSTTPKNKKITTNREVSTETAAMTTVLATTTTTTQSLSTATASSSSCSSSCSDEREEHRDIMGETLEEMRLEAPLASEELLRKFKEEVLEPLGLYYLFE